MALQIPNYASLKPIEVASPLDRYKQILGLRSAGMAVQEQALQLQDAQRKNQQATAVLAALQNAGGDLEKALPEIMRVAPEIGLKYQEVLQQQKQQQTQSEMQARAAAAQNLQLQQGKPAPETQVGTPGMVQPPAEIPQGGFVAPQPMAIPGGFTQEQPLEPVTFPAAAGQPAISVRPQSAQDVFRQKLAQARAEKQQAAEIAAAAKAAEQSQTPGVGIPFPPAVEAQKVRITQAGKTPETLTLTPEQVNVDGRGALVLRDKQGNYFDANTKQPITGRITPYIAPPTPRARGEITPTAEANLIQQLNKQWETAAKDVQALYRANSIMDSGLQAARRGDMNAGSQAILVTFQKFLDPTSVVRESEYARSAQGLAVMERIRGAVERLSQGGAGVTLPELEKFAALGKEIATRMAGEGSSLLSAERKRITAVAERYNLPPELAIPQYNYAAPAGTAPRTTPANTGLETVPTDELFRRLGK